MSRRLARFCGRAAIVASRSSGLGEGSVVGGAVAQRMDPTMATDLADGMRVVVVSGTNGKTTTTRLIADALVSVIPVGTEIATNRSGANLTNGIVGALMDRPDATMAVLEVDEAVVPWALETIYPDTLVLLNLSRDQLDRTHEVGSLADRWRAAIAEYPPRVVVANADDPMVVYAAGDRGVLWVAAGLSWTIDATTCLWCGGAIDFRPTGWQCDRCDRRRPDCTLALADDSVATCRRTHGLGLALPGRSARANAVMALATVEQLGVPVGDALARWRGICSIEGRYETVSYAGSELQLHLAKNPAGWCDTLDLLDGDRLPVVLALNARSEDGRDPSWIWDVPFDQLQDRTVVVLGERASDLSVRLSYADVPAHQATSLRNAMVFLERGPVHVVANYSAFRGLRTTLARAR